MKTSVTESIISEMFLLFKLSFGSILCLLISNFWLRNHAEKFAVNTNLKFRDRFLFADFFTLKLFLNAGSIDIYNYFHNCAAF